MGRREQVEVGLSLLVVAGVAGAASQGLLPTDLHVGLAVLLACLVSLLQSLVRDLTLLARARRAARLAREANPEAGEPAMCLESSLGLGGVLLGGAAWLVLGEELTLPMPWWAWPLAAALVMLGGVWLKDWVFSWSPWRVYRERDHWALIVRPKRRG